MSNPLRLQRNLATRTLRSVGVQGALIDQVAAWSGQEFNSPTRAAGADRPHQAAVVDRRIVNTLPARTIEHQGNLARLQGSFVDNLANQFAVIEQDRDIAARRM